LKLVPEDFLRNSNRNQQLGFSWWVWYAYLCGGGGGGCWTRRWVVRTQSMHMYVVLAWMQSSMCQHLVNKQHPKTLMLQQHFGLHNMTQKWWVCCPLWAPEFHFYLIFFPHWVDIRLWPLTAVEALMCFGFFAFLPVLLQICDFCIWW
jgi:hypothetical protein